MRRLAALALTAVFLTTAALSGSTPVNGTLIRHTVGSAIRKKFGKFFLSSAAPILRLRATTALSLVVCFTTCRGNQTVTKDAASTLLGTANYVGSGSGANVPAITASSLDSAGGDVTLAPTVGAAAELNVFAYEVT